MMQESLHRAVFLLQTACHNEELKILPQRNPNNDKIRDKFGDQGGYH